jgi:hypothetical protein
MSGRRSHTPSSRQEVTSLTVVTEGPGEGGHAAVTAKALPLLQADALIGAGVLLTGGARAWGQSRRTGPVVRGQLSWEPAGLMCPFMVLVTTRRLVAGDYECSRQRPFMRTAFGI